MPVRRGTESSNRGDVEVAFDDGANVVLHRAHLFVQVRGGRMTVEAVDLMSALWRTLRRTDAEKIGALFVIEPTAEVPAADVRTRQAELFREMARDDRLRGALVIEGSGVEATLKRSIARVISLRHQVQIVADVEQGATWLERGLGPGTRAEILALLEQARARLHRR